MISTRLLMLHFLFLLMLWLAHFIKPYTVIKLNKYHVAIMIHNSLHCYSGRCSLKTSGYCVDPTNPSEQSENAAKNDAYQSTRSLKESIM